MPDYSSLLSFVLLLKLFLKFIPLFFQNIPLIKKEYFPFEVHDGCRILLFQCFLGLFFLLFTSCSAHMMHYAVPLCRHSLIPRYEVFISPSTLLLLSLLPQIFHVVVKEV
mmetsp:Transcript_44466/g.43132  ORF Transcript_44466/g.43132 Transcript_44466/m.43132 type:complete len:110 (-) Transcript_44466:349-678(-)